MNRFRVAQRAFTLIELLVVISVIAVLAAMLLPALMGARNRARTISCVGTQKQTLMAIQMYGDDYEEYPDMYNAAGINLGPHGNHPDFATGVINLNGATSLFTIPTLTIKAASYSVPRWQGLLVNYGHFDFKALNCNADRGSWTRNNSSTYNKSYMGFLNGDKTAAYPYFGPGVHWDDVNPQSPFTTLPFGIKWLSDAPYDSYSKYPKNWDLTTKKEKGILICCPSRTMEGTGYADYTQTSMPYAVYNTDFNVIMPHGTGNRERNYGYIDGHVLNTQQLACESLTLYGITNHWPGNPNGYYPLGY